MDSERLIKDLLILGCSLIVGTIISINDFGIRTEFCSNFGLNSSSGSIAIFALFIGYMIASYIVGFKAILEFFEDGELITWILAFVVGHIVGMFLLPIRIIKNIIGLFF